MIPTARLGTTRDEERPQLAEQRREDERVPPRKGEDGPRRKAEHTARPIPFPVPLDIRSISLTGLFLLASFYTLYFARAFLIPVVLAVLLSLLLQPIVRGLKRLGLPEGAGAALVLLAFLGTFIVAVLQLSGPAAQWLAEAPRTVPRVKAKLETVLKPVQRVSETAERVVAAADMDGNKALQVEVKGDSLAKVLFGGTQQFLGMAVVVIFLLFLLLASGDLFLGKLIKVLPRLADKKRAVQIARETEAHVSSYLVTTTLVNAAFGAVIGVAMHFIGLPNPVLWGVVAGVTNFIPYVGAWVCSIVLAAVALIHFDSVRQALLVLLVFQVLNLLEGGVVTPRLVGARLSLNPVVIFTSVLFWGWIWGVPGAILAVPVMATVKIACDHIEGLAPVGEFLGD
jgi:predicted PurR-regulated permease PerM